MTMCFPNDPDELRQILREADYIDRCIDLLKPRSPRVSGARSLAPSLAAAGAGYADSQQDFNRKSQAMGV